MRRERKFLTLKPSIMRTEITKVTRYGLERGKQMEEAKAQAERDYINRLGQETIKEVRQTLLSMLDQYEPRHRETIKMLLAA